MVGKAAKQMKSKYLVISILFIITIAVSGCTTSESSLESYMNKNPQAKANIEQAVSGMSNEDMETEIDFSNNTIIITETLNTEYSEKIVKKMEKNLSEMPEDSFSDAIRDLEDKSMIEGIKVKLILRNGDGEEIMERSYACR